MPEIEEIVRLQLLAREARRRADATDDPDFARRLREIAVRYERQARKLSPPPGQ